MIRFRAAPAPASALRALVAVMSVGCGAAALANTEAPDVRRGHIFAQANCARCHAIGPTGDSPLKAAPPFRGLHRNYPVEQLEEAFAEGIVTGHAAMPEFQLDPGQSSDLIAYLKSIQ